MARSVENITVILDHMKTGGLAYVEPERLRLWRAQLSEAANRVPTHAEMMAQPSAPAEGASDVRGDEA